MDFLLYLKTFYDQNKDTTPPDVLKQILANKITIYFNKQEAK